MFSKWDKVKVDDSDEESDVIAAQHRTPATCSPASNAAANVSSRALDAMAKVAALKARAANSAAGKASGGAATSTSALNAGIVSGGDVLLRVAVATNQAGAAAAYAARLAAEAAELAAAAAERQTLQAAMDSIRLRLQRALDGMLKATTSADVERSTSAAGSDGSLPAPAAASSTLSALETEAAALADRLPLIPESEVSAVLEGVAAPVKPKQAPSCSHEHHNGGDSCSHHGHDHAAPHHHDHDHGCDDSGKCEHSQQGTGCGCVTPGTVGQESGKPSVPIGWKQELALNLVPTRMKLSLATGVAHLVRGRPELTIDLCRRLITSHPKHLPAWLLRGRAYASLECTAGLLLAQLHVDKCLILAGQKPDHILDRLLHDDVDRMQRRQGAASSGNHITAESGRVDGTYEFNGADGLGSVPPLVGPSSLLYGREVLEADWSLQWPLLDSAPATLRTTEASSQKAAFEAQRNSLLNHLISFKRQLMAALLVSSESEHVSESESCCSTASGMDGLISAAEQATLLHCEGYMHSASQRFQRIIATCGDNDSASGVTPRAAQALAACCNVGLAGCLSTLRRGGDWRAAANAADAAVQYLTSPSPMLSADESASYAQYAEGGGKEPSDAAFPLLSASALHMHAVACSECDRFDDAAVSYGKLLRLLDRFDAEGFDFGAAVSTERNTLMRLLLSTSEASPASGGESASESTKSSAVLLLDGLWPLPTPAPTPTASSSASASGSSSAKVESQAADGMVVNSKVPRPRWIPTQADVRLGLKRVAALRRIHPGISKPATGT